jgi:hypothetical protein
MRCIVRGPLDRGVRLLRGELCAFDRAQASCRINGVLWGIMAT